MSNIGNQVMILGLPESGKTSYLAALYHYVSSLKDGKSYEEYQQASDTTYLNKIAELYSSDQDCIANGYC